MKLAARQVAVRSPEHFLDARIGDFLALLFRSSNDTEGGRQ